MFNPFDSSYSNANRRPLTDAELEGAAPSVFATQAMQGVSNRYTYLPTVQLVTAMRENGWLPVHAQEQRVRVENRMGWRHTCATHMVANGANIAYVQRLMGHRSLETTQLYAKVAVAETKETFRHTHPRQQAGASPKAADVPANPTSFFRRK